MFIGVSVSDCTAVWLLCILYHSYLDLASPRRGTCECIMYRVTVSRCVPFRVYLSSHVWHLAGYIEIALFQHGYNKTNWWKWSMRLRTAALSPPEFAPAAPVYKLIKGVIKATNENHDRYHYKPTGVLSPFSSVSRRIKAARLMFAPILLQNRCCAFSSICSPLCVKPTKLKFRLILLHNHLHCSSVCLCHFPGWQLHVLSVRPLHRAAGFCHTKHHGGIRLVHLLHRHHILPWLPGLCHQGNRTQLWQRAQMIRA